MLVWLICPRLSFSNYRKLRRYGFQVVTSLHAAVSCSQFGWDVEPHLARLFSESMNRMWGDDDTWLGRLRS